MKLNTICSSFFASTHVYAQNLKDTSSIESLKSSIVHISFNDKDGRIEGTGFVVAVLPTKIYILTASHLLPKTPTQANLQIKFFQNQLRTYKSRWYDSEQIIQDAYKDRGLGII